MQQSARLARLVAVEIERSIIEEGWPVGHALGCERDLVHRFRVSRGVLREACVLLEERGVASMRQGPGGGLFVVTPDPRAAAHALALVASHHGISAGDLGVVRDELADGEAGGRARDLVVELLALATADAAHQRIS